MLSMEPQIEEKQVKPRKTKIMILIILAIIALAGGAFGYLSHKPPQTEAKVAVKSMKSITLPSMTVNLADSGGSHYLRTTIALEYSSDKDKEELDSSMYKIKDAVLQKLRETTASDWEDPGQTDAIKKVLMDQVNSCLVKAKITGLYFQELLVQ